MRITVDTSAVMAVLFNEPERGQIIQETKSYDLIAPISLPIEVGNAISLAFKRNRLTLSQGKMALDGFEKMRIQLQPINFAFSLQICHEAGIYAYDSYMLDISEREKSTLLTLDVKLKNVAKDRGIKLLEV